VGDLDGLEIKHGKEHGQQKQPKPPLKIIERQVMNEHKRRQGEKKERKIGWEVLIYPFVIGNSTDFSQNGGDECPEPEEKNKDRRRAQGHRAGREIVFMIYNRERRNLAPKLKEKSDADGKEEKKDRAEYPRHLEHISDY
jgi:hypothetical protein